MNLSEWLIEKHKDEFIYVRGISKDLENYTVLEDTNPHSKTSIYSPGTIGDHIRIPYAHIITAIKTFKPDNQDSFLIYSIYEKRFKKIIRSPDKPLVDFIRWLTDCSYDNFWSILYR